MSRRASQAETNARQNELFRHGASQAKKEQHPDIRLGLTGRRIIGNRRDKGEDMGGFGGLRPSNPPIFLPHSGDSRRTRLPGYLALDC